MRVRVDHEADAVYVNLTERPRLLHRGPGIPCLRSPRLSIDRAGNAPRA
jgi:hypothetical protein